MNYFLLLLIVLQICSTYSEVNKESGDGKSDTSGKKYRKSRSELLVLNSIAYELTNVVLGNDSELNQCEQELQLIKEGIKRKDLWALKSKYSGLEIN